MRIPLRLTVVESRVGALLGAALVSDSYSADCGAVDTEGGPRRLVTWPVYASVDDAARKLALTRRLAALTSPHLSPVLAWGLSGGGQPFVVYDSPSKPAVQPVRAAVERGTPPVPTPLPLLVDRALALCAGLATLHRAGFLAERLHEGNLEYVGDSAHGEPGTAPAGIRLLLPTPPSTSRILAIPPECLGHEQTFDERSEIWLLGELLFGLFCGRPSYEGSKLQAVLNIRQAPPLDPVKLRPDLPSAISDLLLRCLDKRPERRPPDVAAIAAVLFPLRSRENTWAKPIEPLPMTPKPLRVSLDEAIGLYEDFAKSLPAKLGAAPSTEDAITPAAVDEQHQLNHAAACYVRGVQRLGHADHAAAEADFSRALQLDPCFEHAWALAVCRLGRTEREPVQQALLLARGYLAKDSRGGLLPGELFGAAASLAEAETYYLEGLVAAQHGDGDTAIAALGKALARVPLAPGEPVDPAVVRETVVRFHCARSVVLHRQGKFAEAVADCDQALRHQPDSAEVLWSRGLSYYAMGQYRAALSDYSRAIAANPTSGEYYYCRGLAYQRIGERRQAEADQHHAVQLGFTVHPKRG